MIMNFILDKIHSLFVGIMFLYFCSNFICVLIVFYNGILFIGKFPIIFFIFTNLQPKKKNKRKVKYKYLYLGNKVKEITI
jgi:hypothetical protein